MTDHPPMPADKQSTVAPMGASRTLARLLTRLLVSLPAAGLVWWSIEYFLAHRSGQGLFLGSLILWAGLAWYGLCQAGIDRSIRQGLQTGPTCRGLSASSETERHILKALDEADP